MLEQKKRALTLAAIIFYPAIAFLLLKCAPFPGKGLIQFIDYMNKEMEHPFRLAWSNQSIPVLLIGTAIYVLIVFLVVTSLKNTRPMEEYGSAKWMMPGRVTRKYKARRPVLRKKKALLLELVADGTKEEMYDAAYLYLLTNQIKNTKLPKSPSPPKVKRKKQKLTWEEAEAVGYRPIEPQMDEMIVKRNKTRDIQ